MKNLTYGSTTIKQVFAFSYTVLLFSRLAVISGNYTINFDPVLLEIIYLVFLSFWGLYVNNFKIEFNKLNKTFTVICFLLMLYIVLFGIVFVNPEIRAYTSSMFKRQNMFFIIVIITSIIIIKYKLFDTFLLVSFFVTSITLMLQFITNISELNLTNLMNALSFTERTRVNFGFGHYNLLGGTCVCNILNWLLIKKRNLIKPSTRIISMIFVILSVIMLLSSASRTAITSLIIFGGVYLFINLNKLPINKNVVILLRILIIAGITFVGILTFSGTSFDDLIYEANRFTLFDAALPTFFKSERTWIGLGYAANEVYGTHLTPYLTYWLDNSYMYTLVTTGYIGSSIYAVIILIILKRINKLKNIKIGKYMICIFAVYLYIGLFEVTLFIGTAFGYFYVILLLVYISNYFSERTNKMVS